MTKKDIAAMLEDGLTEDDIMKMVKEVKAEQEKKKLDAAEAAKKQEKIKVARERAIRALVDYVSVVTGEVVSPEDTKRVEKSFTDLESVVNKLDLFARPARPERFRVDPDTDSEWTQFLLSKYF
jgi:hypothetical protein